MPEVQLSPELLEKIIASAIRAATAPSTEQLEKKAKEKADEDRRMAEMIEVARAEEKSRKDQWENCGHKKPNGQPSVGGQVHSDGMVHLICLRCQFPFPPFKPPEDQVARGI